MPPTPSRITIRAPAASLIGWPLLAGRDVISIMGRQPGIEGQRNYHNLRCGAQPKTAPAAPQQSLGQPFGEKCWSSHSWRGLSLHSRTRQREIAGNVNLVQKNVRVTAHAPPCPSTTTIQ